MLQKILLTLLALCLVSFIASCSSFNEQLTAGGEVTSVYWHGGNRYTVGILSDGKLRMQRLPSRVPVTIFVDVPHDKSPWYICNWVYSVWNGVQKGGGCALHIQSVDSLKTAGWNHGKFGTGETSRLN